MIRYLTPAAALAAAASPALADAERYGHMMGWGYGTGMLFGPVLWILILGLVVAGIIWFARQPGVSSTRNDALAMLDMRLAKGEIDADEYTARKKLLIG